MKRVLILILLFCLSMLFVSCKIEPIEFNIISDDSVEVGKTIYLTHNYEGDLTPIWNVDNDSIASLNDETLKGLSVGTVKITLTIGDVVKDKLIEVKESSLELTITGESTLIVGDTSQLSVTTSFETNDIIKWSSSDEKVASVSETGLVTSVAPGSVIITAELYGKTSEYIVIVKEKDYINISGNNLVKVGNYLDLILNTNIVEEIVWSTSDSNIATIDNTGKLYGVNPGEVTVYAKHNDIISEYLITVFDISINEISSAIVGDIIKLDVTTSALNNPVLLYSSSDDNIASVSSDGYVTFLANGTVSITVFLESDSSVFSTIEINVKEKNVIACDLEMMQGSYNYLKYYQDGEEVNNGLTWSVNDPKLAIVSGNIMLAVNKGTVTVNCKGNGIDESVDVTIKEYKSEKPSTEDLARVEEILSKMTLNQKVGQMFVVGLGGTSLGNDLKSAVQKCNFGNVIYMGYNVTSPNTLASLSNSVQDLLITNNTVPGFICTDQEGGRVARLTNGGTHFISNMAMAGTNYFNNTYLEGVAMGKELRNYGINVDFAPVLDVNNNPNNPIIGIRSYSDNPLKVGLYGVNMFTGLQSENVMGCSKHFPGHGNTSTDSHYGLPQIDTGIDKLYQTELAPFISAVSNGIDSIMTTHIIFSAIDKTYPATLSEKVLTGLLREELGFDGLIITDGMEMAAVTENFGGADEIAVLAVKAGVDILTYTSNNTPQTAHSGIMAAIKNGEITEERINESVRRILLKKIKYDVLDGYKAKNDNITEMLEEHNELNIKFAMDSLTQVRGTFNGIDKSKKVLIISPTTNYDLGSNVNSFANYASNYLKLNGYTSDFEEVSTNIKANDSTRIVEKAKSYDVVVVAMSNVKTSNYSRSANFVNSLAKLNNELVVIALDTPYDILSYSGVDNYICVYGYQKATVIALSRYLNGEFKAVGVCPVEAVK